MCEITESESMERRLESLHAENERLRDDVALYVGRIRRLAVERDRMRAACEAAREFLEGAVDCGLIRQEKGRVLVLIRAALDGVDPPGGEGKTVTVTPEQYERGYAVDRREPFRLIRRLPDGNYLVEDPAAGGKGEGRDDHGPR